MWDFVTKHPIHMKNNNKTTKCFHLHTQNEGLVTLTKSYIQKEKKKKQRSQDILNQQAGMLSGTVFSGLLQQTNSVFEKLTPAWAEGLLKKKKIDKKKRKTQNDHDELLQHFRMTKKKGTSVHHPLLLDATDAALFSVSRPGAAGGGRGRGRGQSIVVQQCFCLDSATE